LSILQGSPLSLQVTLTSSDSAVVTITPQGALHSVGPRPGSHHGTFDAFVDQMIVYVIDSTIVARLTLPGSRWQSL
jgi:hypothetical protein